MSEKVVKKVKKSLYMVWVIPLVAIILASWMIYKYYSGLGEVIVVTVNDAAGFEIKKTPLIYRGVKVGFIKSMEIDKDDISKVNVSILVHKKSFSHIAKSNSSFVKVSPKISSTEISGLSTIFSGSYIEVFTKSKNLSEIKKDKFQDHFIAIKKKEKSEYRGLEYIKLSYKNATIADGAPILYKKEAIGQVINHKLEKEQVSYIAQIDEEYVDLIKEHTRFYKIKAIDVKASLSGIDVQLDSLATLLSGGLSFVTDSNDSDRVDNSKTFAIFNSLDDAVLDDDIITLVAKKAYRLNASQTHIYYKGFNAGKIISIDYLPSKDETHFKFKFKPEFKSLANYGLYFWIVEPTISLGKVEGIDTIFSGNYISFEKDSTQGKKQRYNLHESAPQKSGLHLQLQAKNMQGLSEGGVVLYLNKEVGRIDSVSFNKESGVKVDVTIFDEYSSLVNNSSIFYLNSLIKSKIDFKEVKLEIPTLKSMILGGITFDTLNKGATSSKRTFLLYEDQSSVEEQAYLNSGGKFITLSSKTLNALHKNAPIFYKEMEVGKIIDYSYDGDKFIFKAYIEKNYAHLINDSTYFYNSSKLEVDIEFPKVKVSTTTLEQMLRGGLSFKTKIKDAAYSEERSFTIYKNEEEATDENFIIHLMLNNDKGLKVGSKITYKSIVLGKITSIELNDESYLSMKAIINKKYKKYFKDDTKMWVENFSLSVDGVKNVSSLVTGASIAIYPGDDKKERRLYYLLENKPSKSFFNEGLRVVLKAKRGAGLKVDSPLYYRQFQIGNVEQIELSNSSEYVKIVVFIEKCYAYIIRKNSIFYNVGGVGVELDVTGLKMKTETLSSIVEGGISVVTPDNYTKRADEFENFTLEYELKEKWLEYKPKLLNSESECS